MAAIPVNFVIVVSLFIFLWFLLGLHNILTRVEPNACEMTYMFEYPQYVEIALPKEIQRSNPRYTLYGYGEGGKIDDLRKMKFTGIPVLYIPGSGGSHKQGRSLASVALRKALKSRSPFHFDFFLVDFNEDLSGAYGGVLNGQTKYVVACIDKVLSLYKKSKHELPSSVVLVGHSAGGLVAKGVFSEANFNKDSVRLIITLATPHSSPVVQPDWYLTEYYSKVNKLWSLKTENTSHVTLLSLGGGERDLLVRSDLIKDTSAYVNVLTTEVPGVWCSMDHLSITWCKQLILTIIRALFDSVDLQTKQITEDSHYIRDILDYHFIKRSAGKKFLSHPVRSAFEKKGKWVEKLLRQYSVVEMNGVKDTQFLMLRLIDDPKHQVAIIQTVNLNVKDWIYVCDANVISGESRVCDEGVNLSNLTEIMPAHKLRRKLIRLNLLELKEKGFSHVVVRIPPSSTFVQVNVDVHRMSDRVVNLAVPRMTALSTSTVVDNTADNAIYYKIHLTGFDQIWQAFGAHLEAVNCKAQSNHAVMTFSVPWANETRNFSHADAMFSTSTLKLTSPRPMKWNPNETATLQLILDPSCKYKLTLSPDRIAIAGQVARYYAALLPGYVVAVILMTLRRQLESVDAGTGVPLFHNALAQSVSKYYILLQAVIIGSKVLGYRLLAAFIPQPDPTTLHEASLDFFFLPIIMFGIATSIVYFSGAIIYGSIIISGQAANKLALRFLARTFTGFLSWSEWIFSGLHQLPFIVAIILLSLSYATVGGLAIALAAAFYFLKLCKLYDDYLEDLMKISLIYVAKKIKSVAMGNSKSKPTVEETNAKTNIKQTSETNSEEKTNKAVNDERTKESVNDKKTKEAFNDEKPKEAGYDEKTKEFVNDGTCVEVSEDGGRGDEEKTVDEAMAIAEESASTAAQQPDASATADDEPELSTLEEIHFHVTMCLLYVVVGAVTVPSVLAWSRSFHESPQLKLDPAWLPSLVFCGAGAILWQGSVPKPNKKLDRLTRSVLFVISVFCIMFGSITHYRLPFFASAALIYLVYHQLSVRWF